MESETGSGSEYTMLLLLLQSSPQNLCTQIVSLCGFYCTNYTELTSGNAQQIFTRLLLVAKQLNIFGRDMKHLHV